MFNEPSALKFPQKPRPESKKAPALDRKAENSNEHHVRQNAWLKQRAILLF
jgi:hypothetical protein